MPTGPFGEFRVLLGRGLSLAVAESTADVGCFVAELRLSTRDILLLPGLEAAAAASGRRRYSMLDSSTLVAGLGSPLSTASSELPFGSLRRGTGFFRIIEAGVAGFGAESWLCCFLLGFCVGVADDPLGFGGGAILASLAGRGEIELVIDEFGVAAADAVP